MHTKMSSLATPSYKDFLDTEFSNLGAENLPVFSFFSGGGGLDLGFEAAGFSTALCSDIYEEYLETLSTNLPDANVLKLDIAEFTKFFEKNINDKSLPVGVIGGPPCQSFSILGSRSSIQDPRGALVFDYITAIKLLQPAFFVFENVPGILTVNKGRDWQNLLDTFQSELGYKLYHTTLNSMGFGVPQSRNRVFVVGFKRLGSQFLWPKYEYSFDSAVDLFSKSLPRTVADAFADIGNAPNNEKRVHGERVANRYAGITPGERDRVDHTDRLVWDKPSGTVLVGSGGGGGRPFIHPQEHRHITVREAARLQSFPDWWEFKGGSTKQYRQVGNAVPPIMAKRLATSIMEVLRS